MNMRRAPPITVFVSWCSRCGATICADRTAEQAKHASGCQCAVGRERVKAVPYVLATKKVKWKR